jgi:hypothetical protein
MSISPIPIVGLENKSFLCSLITVTCHLPLCDLVFDIQILSVGNTLAPIELNQHIAARPSTSFERSIVFCLAMGNATNVDHEQVAGGLRGT